MNTQLEPVSLGYNCATKFQACLSLYLRVNPQGSVDRLRETLTGKRSADLFPRHIFDWQITPLAAVIAYLEADFQGVFERDDLEIASDGLVTHRRLGTQHPHDFHAAGEVLQEAQVDAQYPAARAKFEHLAAKFRAHLADEGPFLYVASAAPNRQQASRLEDLLSRQPRHGFQLLFAQDMGGPPLGPLGGRIREAYLPKSLYSGIGDDWEGDPQAWASVFAPYDIGLPRGPHFNGNLNPILDLAGVNLRDIEGFWRRLPSCQLAGLLPQTFSIPATAWENAAATTRLDALAAEGARTLYVSMEVIRGRAGVGLMHPDGSCSIGPEHCVDPSEGLVHIPLALDGQMGPACVVIRNYGDAGRKSLARVHALRASA